MILNNTQYNKIKLIHELSCLSWFIKQHALEDAKKDNDTAAHALLERLKKDVEEYSQELTRMVCKDSDQFK